MKVSRGTVYKDPKSGTWYYSLNIDGQRIREAIGKSKSEARAALEARKIDALRGEFRFKKDVNITFKDFATEFIDIKRNNCPRSWTMHETSLKNLMPLFGNMLLSRISFRHIEKYKGYRLTQYDKRVKEGSNSEKKSINPATINRELTTLKNMFNIAIKMEYVSENPVTEIKFFSERQIPIRILNIEERQRLIDSMDGSTKSITILAINTGMRKGEILKLRWNDIDFNERYIHVKITKTNQPRKVPMNQTVFDLLKSYDRKSEWVFYNPKTGNHIADVKKSFKTACGRAGFSDFRFHDLRHNAASYMVNHCRVDLVTAGEILGHRDIHTTRRYLHTSPTIKKAAVEALGEFLSEKPQRMVREWSEENGEDSVNNTFQSN